MTFKYGAIPTEYKGIRFRSRTEARWAAFFDAVGWSWEYEPYDLAGWIPDFALTVGGKVSLVEVKPASTQDELESFVECRQLSRCPEGTVLLGSHPYAWSDRDPNRWTIGLQIVIYDGVLPSATERERALCNAFHAVLCDRDVAIEAAMEHFAGQNKIPYGERRAGCGFSTYLCECGSLALPSRTGCGCGRRIAWGADTNSTIESAWAHAQNATQWKGRGR